MDATKIQVKWVAATDLYDHDGSYVSRIPVIPLAALTDVAEGLRLALDYYRSNGSQKFNPYEVEQRLEKILTRLEVHRKET